MMLDFPPASQLKGPVFYLWKHSGSQVNTLAATTVGESVEEHVLAGSYDSLPIDLLCNTTYKRRVKKKNGKLSTFCG